MINLAKRDLSGVCEQRSHS